MGILRTELRFTERNHVLVSVKNKFFHITLHAFGSLYDDDKG